MDVRVRFAAAALVFALAAGLPVAPAAAAAALVVEQVAVINPSGDAVDSFGSEFAAVGDTVFFRADDGENGRELWATDGTADGTWMVADIRAAPAGSFPHQLAAVGDRLFFAARSDEAGAELWVSDGTEAGTRMVADINPGADSSNPRHLTAFGDLLLFTASDGTGAELWRSDGTAAGTRMVADINTTPGSEFFGASISQLTVVGERVFFRADDGVHGAELWVSDGTTAGTRLVRDIRPGASSSFPSGLTAFGDRLLFTANDGVHGVELWVSDGTAPGTVLLADINPGAADSAPVGFADLGGVLLFVAADVVNGREPRRTDGTTAGTRLVADVNPGSGDSRPPFSGPLDAAVVDGVAYLRLDDGVHGAELWRSDGTAAGTRLVADLQPGAQGSSVGSPTALGGGVLFAATAPGVGGELFWSDGTPEDTVLARDINPTGHSDALRDGHSGAVSLPAVGETVLFFADDGASGRQLWRASLARPPGPPTAVAATAGDASAAVSWSPPEDDGGTPVTGYTVRAEPGDATADAGGDATSATVEGLANGTSYTFTVAARNAAGEGTPSAPSDPVIPTAGAGPPSPSPPAPSPPAPGECAVTDPPAFDGDPITSVRVDHDDPAAAAVALSRARFCDHDDPGGPIAAHVVVSRDDDFPDSLTGAALTAGGPMLLTPTARLSADAAEEVARVLAPGGTVYLLGGTVALDQAVADAVDAAGFAVRRLSGVTRVETGVAVADEIRRLQPDQRRVGLARAFGHGEPTAAWADSVTGGGWAASEGVPILVTASDGLHPAVAGWLDGDGPSQTVLLGGTVALSAEVAAAVPNPLRVSGPERTATAAAVATELLGAGAGGPRRFVILNGAHPHGWAFGLPAGGLVADAGAPLLMVRGDLPAATRALVSGCGHAEVDLVILGGDGVVSDTLREELEAADGGDC